MATTVSESKQDSDEFESLLKKALAVDPEARPEWKLSNVVQSSNTKSDTHVQSKASRLRVDSLWILFFLNF